MIDLTNTFRAMEIIPTHVPTVSPDDPRKSYFERTWPLVHQLARAVSRHCLQTAAPVRVVVHGAEYPMFNEIELSLILQHTETGHEVLRVSTRVAREDIAHDHVTADRAAAAALLEALQASTRDSSPVAPATGLLSGPVSQLSPGSGETTG